MTLKRPNANVVLGLSLLVALGSRLINIGFGLPALYDPDEGLFVLKAFKLISDHSLNPGWFGHPGTTTIYLLALVDIAVAAVGLASGRFATLPQFAAAVYAHPGLIFVPSRLAMVLIGVGAVWLTFLVARRLFDPPTALVAAAFLGVNSLHIAWSQVIRTDIHCSLFMLAALLFAVRGAQHGGRRDFVVAGLFAGFALATKWPGGSILIAVGGAAVHRWRGGDEAEGAERRHDIQAFVARMALAGAAAVAGLFLASPYIFLDWRTVIANVSGEVASGHLGHSGHGFVANLGWYLTSQVAGGLHTGSRATMRTCGS